MATREHLDRACQASLEILDGAEVLNAGREEARRLWNYLYHCVVGYNRHLARVRGDFGSLAGKLPRYAGFFTLQHEMQDYASYRNLSDRCASYTVKDFDIAMRSWFANLKRNPKARPPRPIKDGRTLTFEVGCNARPVGNFMYRLTVLGGHIPERHAVVRIRTRPGLRMSQIKLLRVKTDNSASLIYRLEKPDAAPGTAVAALDLGIVNLVALAFDSGETILYNGRALLDIDRHGQQRAAACKPSGYVAGTQNSRPSPRCRQYRRKAARIRALAVHNLTTHIIRECVARGVGTLALGDLTGIREGKDFGAAGNQKLHAWPFAEIRRQLEYKGEEVGIEVKAVSERYTSQTCARCGAVHKSSRVMRGLYRCAECGWEVNADVNGAINILRKVSPEARAFGVEAGFPGLPSPVVAARGIGEPSRAVANAPAFCAKFDLRDWHIIMTRQTVAEALCNNKI